MGKVTNEGANFVGRKWTFLMRLYTWENTVYDKSFLYLPVDASLLTSLQILSVYPSPDGCPRAQGQEEPLDWRVRQNISKRRSWGRGPGEAPMATWPECSPWAATRQQGKDKHTNTQLLTVTQIPSHRPLPASRLTDTYPVSPLHPSLFGAKIVCAIS